MTMDIEALGLHHRRTWQDYLGWRMALVSSRTHHFHRFFLDEQDTFLPANHEILTSKSIEERCIQEAPLFM
jgi:hypothetical protein